MSGLVHDTLIEIEQGTPAYFSAVLWLLPVALLLQFLLAGQSLFAGLAWQYHAMLGVFIAVPVLAIVVAAMTVRRLRGFRWWSLLLLVLYGLQFVLAVSGAKLLGLHPMNAALLLLVSLVLLFKLERRRAFQRRSLL